MVSDQLADTRLCIPNAASIDQLALVHHWDYIQRVIEGQLTPIEMRRIGFPWSLEMVERSRRSVGATIDAALAAHAEGVSVNLAGGTHHAFPDAGQGYCVFNDVVVAARTLQKLKKIERALIIDLDVHQGNGTAAIAHTDPTLFSFSMHCEKNYPFRKSTGDLDIALPPGTKDSHYLSELDRALNVISQQFQFDFVFYVAGADPFTGDRLGQLNLSKLGLQQRDQRVFEFCEQSRVPVAVSMAGGYAEDVNDIVDIHFQTVLASYRSFQNRRVFKLLTNIN